MSEAEERFYKTGRFPRDILIVVALVAAFPAWLLLFPKCCDDTWDAKPTATVSQVKSYIAAVAAFEDKYKALPGDMADAGAKLTGCTGTNGSDCNPATTSAGDGIIGSPNFIKSLKPQVLGNTRVPAISAGDETILFWNHLLLANWINGVTTDGMKNGSPVTFGVTMPKAKIGGGFIVGYSNGTPLPVFLSPINAGLKGIVLVQVSDAVLQGNTELDEPDEQALTPLKAAQIDRKMDDGRPGTGNVQAYGAPGCFMNLNGGYNYNETSSKHDCGLIYKIADSPKDVKHPEPESPAVIPKKRSD